MNLCNAGSRPVSWQLAKGGSGFWYFVEQDKAGRWVQVAGPYHTADDAAQGTGTFPEMPIRTPSEEPRIVRGINGWSIIVHIGTSLWGQIAGPFRTRRDARNWTWGMAGSLMDRRW